MNYEIWRSYFVGLGSVYTMICNDIRTYFIIDLHGPGITKFVPCPEFQIAIFGCAVRIPLDKIDREVLEKLEVFIMSR